MLVGLNLKCWPFKVATTFCVQDAILRIRIGKHFEWIQTQFSRSLLAFLPRRRVRRHEEQSPSSVLWLQFSYTASVLMRLMLNQSHKNRNPEKNPTRLETARSSNRKNSPEYLGNSRKQSFVHEIDKLSSIRSRLIHELNMKTLSAKANVNSIVIKNWRMQVKTTHWSLTSNVLL